MHNQVMIGIIGGTGLGEAITDSISDSAAESHDIDTPFGKPSSTIVTTHVGGVPIALLQRHGQGHVINPAAIPARANIFALKKLGCTHILASGATGSLREEIAPGDLVLCHQLIDKTDGRARTFYENAAVHVEFAEPFCPIMRSWLIQAAKQLSDLTIHERGTYICMEGPSFSTKAESNMHRQWGGDLIGMTALPEVRLAREAEIAYALIALPTDYDCWRQSKEKVDHATLLDEIIANLNRATQASIKLIRYALSDISLLKDQQSPAHNALELAIWSDKSKIDPTEIKKLEILWGRYF